MKPSSIKLFHCRTGKVPGPLLLTIITLLLVSVASGQNNRTEKNHKDGDSSQIIVEVNQTTPHKRGVYKTYDEYLQDHPSIDAEFTSTQLSISRKNDLIIAAKIKFKGKRQKPIWGFSDGQYVYVRAVGGQLFQNHYWKLQCDGPRPYVYYAEKPIFFVGGMGLAVAAAGVATSAALPPLITMMVVEPKTKKFHQIKMIGKRKMRLLLKEYPDLLESFNEVPQHIMGQAVKAKYLTEYNKRKIAVQP